MNTQGEPNSENNNQSLVDSDQQERSNSEDQSPIPLANILADKDDSNEANDAVSLGHALALQLDEEKDFKKPFQKTGLSLSFQVPKGVKKQEENAESLRSKSFELDWKITIDTEDKLEENNRMLSTDKKWAFCGVCKLGLGYNQVMKAFKYIQDLPSGIDRDEMLLQAIDHVIQDSPKPKNRASQPQTKPKSAIELQPKPESAVAPPSVHLHKSFSFQKGKADLNIVEGDVDVANVVVDVKDEEEEGIPCEICYENIAEDKLKQPLACKHTFCHNCYINYFNEKISTNQVLEIKCPDSGCTNNFIDENIKELLPEERYQEYIKFKTNKILNQNPNLRWCVRNGCGKYAVGKEGCEKVTCECGTQICFQCRNEYHPKKTCDQAMDKAYKDYILKFDVQKCPRCKNGVEKIDGCNHMRCPVCSYEWCWLCGGKYSRAHYSMLNPFGCGGLQRGRNTRSKWPCWKIHLWRVVRILLVLLALCLVPVAWAIGSAILPNIIYSQQSSLRYTTRRRQRRTGVLVKRDLRKQRCKFRMMQLLMIIIGIVFLPILMIGTLVTGIFLGCKELKRYCRRRRWR